MKPCRKWHGDFQAGCHVCERVRIDPPYAAKWGEPEACTHPYADYPPDVLAPLGRTRFDRPGAGFNATHLGEFLAWRTGWAGSEIWINGRCMTDLRHERAGYGREDPRLFRFRDRPHLAFTGVDGQFGPTHQLYARLSPAADKIERVWAPHYIGRREWEKNWQFFEHERELYAVYEIGPTHKILHVRGDRADLFAETPTRLNWSGGEMRGGAPPVRVGDVFYHWFHGARDVHGRRRYNVGVYAFKAKPPFNVVGMTPDPILWADPRNCPPEIWADVVFPGGASYDPGSGLWTVTCGIHDRWFEQLTWRHQDVMALLAQPTVRHPLPCLYLEKRVERANCACPRKDSYQCGKGHGVVRPGVECESCNDYEADA